MSMCLPTLFHRKHSVDRQENIKMAKCNILKAILNLRCQPSIFRSSKQENLVKK